MDPRRPLADKAVLEEYVYTFFVANSSNREFLDQWIKRHYDPSTVRRLAEAARLDAAAKKPDYGYSVENTLRVLNSL